MDAAASVHPTDQTLRSYGLGTLEDALAGSVSKHVADCSTCQSRVAELSSDDFEGPPRNTRELHEMSGASRSPDGGSASARGPAVAVERRPSGTLPPGLAEHPDYEVIRELGRGGMGVVYLVRNTLMKGLEVLKVVGDSGQKYKFCCGMKRR
jgi:serine/threonine protein kinase